MKTETYLGYIATTAQFECSYFSIHLRSRPDSAKMKFLLPWEQPPLVPTGLYADSLHLRFNRLYCVWDMETSWSMCKKRSNLLKYLLPWHPLL